MRWLLPKRPELKLIISSATLDTRLFSARFNHAPIISITGRMFPIEIRYEPVIALWQGVAMRSYVDGVVHAVETILDSKEPGDILAFLPTVDDIKECWNILFAKTKKRDVCVLPLFGRMAPEEQEKIFGPNTVRRIVLATNIAETSITVPNIRFVIDTGLSRCVGFDSRAGINRMPVSPISQASANQRAGRCGRVRNGICIRLYSRHDFDSRPKFTVPEIRRVNCAGVLLRMANLGIDGQRRFPFLQPPSPAAIDAGFRQLRFLGAVRQEREPHKIRARHGPAAFGPRGCAHAFVRARTRRVFRSRDHRRRAVGRLALGAASADKGDAWSRTFSARLCLGFYDLCFTLAANSSTDKTANFPENCSSGFCLEAGLSLQHVKEWIRRSPAIDENMRESGPDQTHGREVRMNKSTRRCCRPSH